MELERLPNDLSGNVPSKQTLVHIENKQMSWKATYKDFLMAEENEYPKLKIEEFNDFCWKLFHIGLLFRRDPKNMLLSIRGKNFSEYEQAFLKDFFSDDNIGEYDGKRGYEDGFCGPFDWYNVDFEDLFRKKEILDEFCILQGSYNKSDSPKTIIGNKFYDNHCEMFPICSDEHWSVKDLKAFQRGGAPWYGSTKRKKKRRIRSLTLYSRVDLDVVKKVARKRVHMQYIKKFSDVDLKDFEGERNIKCDKFVDIQQVHYSEKELILFMELMDFSLLDILVEFYYSSHKHRTCFIPDSFIWHVAKEVLEGLSYLFEKTKKPHGDLHLAEVFLNKEGKVKLTAFNGTPIPPLQKILIRQLPVYIAPERVSRNPNPKCDIRSDVWSLGVMLFALATGNIPFTYYEVDVQELRKSMSTYVEDNKQSYLCDASEQLKKFIDDCLDPDIDNRPYLPELLESINNCGVVICENDAATFLRSCMDC